MLNRRANALALVAALAEHEGRGRRRDAERARRQMMDLARSAPLDDARLLLGALASRVPWMDNVRQAPDARRFGRELLELARERLGEDDIVTTHARLHLAHASAVDHLEEAVTLTEAALPVLEREGAERGKISVERGNVEHWLRRLGRDAQADEVREVRCRSLPLCEHLRPVEDHVLRRGGSVRERGVWSGVFVAVDAFFDPEPVSLALSLASCVEPVVTDDIHYGRFQGLRCLTHGDSIVGAHQKDKATVADVT